MAASMRDELLTWFDRHRRDLPWRRTRDPYAIWLSEVMLQQTQVQAVIPYWQRFLARFPTVHALAAAPLPDVFALWKGLGYYARARNLHRAAQELVERHGGVLPRTAEALEALPGFGRYTAGAVASIAHEEPAPIVDGNVARVFARVFELEGAPGDRAREKQLWAKASELVQGPRPGDFNQALMELGATVCRPEAPTCLLCPWRERCGARKHGRIAELPPPRVRKPRERLELAVAVWRREDELLFARRAEGGLFGGLWELPSTPRGEDPAAALLRLLGKSVRVGEALGRVSRTLTHRDLSLELFTVSGRPVRRLAGYQELRWATSTEAESLGMSTAMAKAVEHATRVR